MKIPRTSFNTGEISPVLWWRSDLSKYGSSCKQVENYINLPQGGVRRRFGTEVVSRIGDVTNNTRLIVWEVDRTAYFQLVFLGTDIFVYDANGAQVAEINSIPWANTDFEQLYTKQIFDVMYIAHPDYPLQKISRTDDFVWEIAEHEFNPVPFLEANLDTTDTMSMFAGGWAGGTFAVTVSSISDHFASTDEGGWLRMKNEEPSSDSDNYGTGSVGTGSAPIQASGTVKLRTEGGIWDGRLDLEVSYDKGLTFESIGSISSKDGKHNGSIERDVIKPDAQVRAFMTERASAPSDSGCIWVLEVTEQQYNYIKIVNYVDAQNIEGILEIGTLVPLTTYNWAFGAFSDTNGYPTCVEIYEERMMLGGVKAKPATIYGSKINDWTDYQTGTLATSPITFSLSADVRNRIRWMVPEQSLIIGSDYGEWTIGSRDSQTALSGENVSARRQTQFGTEPIQPITSSDMTLYVEAGGKRLRSTQYSYEKDGYVSVDMSILAPHLTKDDDLKRMAFSRSPDQIIWAVRSDGTLLSFTYEREHGVSAWARQPFSDGGSVIDVNSILTTTGDVVSLLVNRSDGLYFEVIRKDSLCFDWQKLYENVLPTEVATLKGDENFKVYNEVLTEDEGSFIAKNTGVYVRIVNAPVDLVIHYDGEPIELDVDFIHMGSDLYWINEVTTKGLVEVFDFITPLVLNTDYFTYQLSENRTIDLLTDVYLPSELTIEVSAVPLVENVGYWNMENIGQMMIIGGSVSASNIVVKYMGTPLGSEYYDVVIARAQVASTSTNFYVAVEMQSLLETTDIGNVPDMGGAGNRHRVNEVDVFVVDSVGGEVSCDSGETWEEIKQTEANVVMGERIPEYTGKFEVRTQHGFNEDQTVSIRNTTPYNQIIASFGAKTERYSS